MPWRGVTVSEQKQRFLEDYQLNYCSIAELAERFSISRKTAHKWIDRFEQALLEVGAQVAVVFVQEADHFWTDEIGHNSFERIVDFMRSGR